jgi:hypothetical protein
MLAFIFINSQDYLFMIPITTYRSPFNVLGLSVSCLSVSLFLMGFEPAEQPVCKLPC